MLQDDLTDSGQDFHVENVNVENAKTAREKILEKMESANVKELVFKRNMTVSNFAKDLQISNANGEVVSVDPQLLFRKLVAILFSK